MVTTRTRRIGIVLVAGAISTVAAGGVAQAEVGAGADRVCDGSFGAIRIDDDLRVPPGAMCNLTGTTVTGDVTVGRSSSLVATDARLQGNVESRGAAEINLVTSRVGGDMQSRSGGAVRLDGSTLSGNVELSRNTAEILINANLIRSDVRLTGNRGGVEVTDNRISGNLQCSRNNPPPTGDRNTVRGDKEGQCRGL